MNNIGEEIAGEYLRIFKECDFIQYNLYTPDIQGEIDVVGIDIKNKKVYLCEVAIHLITGLQYVKNKQPDNVDRFISKFNKSIDYAEKYFGEYDKQFMLWSPIVRNQGVTSKHNQFKDLKKVKEAIASTRKYDIELIINHEFQECMQKLREHASNETKELKSPVLRLMQIESRLVKHLQKPNKNIGEGHIDKIIASYDQVDEMIQSSAYGSGGTNLLFPRLMRAALNQCCNGDATVSRYAIWANTVRDHISTAIRLIESGDKEEGFRLLTAAHNSLSAFSEIQKQLDPFEK